jgi:hypothetical protein
MSIAQGSIVIPVPQIAQKQMRVLISGYLEIRSAMDRMESSAADAAADLTQPEVAEPLNSLDDYESRMAILTRRYARQFPASNWALGIIPPVLAAGMAAGIPTNITIQGPFNLITLCGMEPRRYISQSEAREMMRSVLGRKKKQFEEADIEELARQSGRSAAKIAPPYTWAEVLQWLTKSNHMEFLRTICLRMGEWFSRDYAASSLKYREVYRSVLERESSDHPHLIEAQFEHRAQNAAVRVFLTDYTQQLLKGGQQ